MAKLIGLKKVKTAIFISGTGSNLLSLIKFSKNYKSPISIEYIVSNNSKAKGLYYAKKYNIKKKVFNFKLSLIFFITSKDSKFPSITTFLSSLK